MLVHCASPALDALATFAALVGWRESYYDYHINMASRAMRRNDELHVARGAD